MKKPNSLQRRMVNSFYCFHAFLLLMNTGHLTGCVGADPRNSLTSASSAS